MGGEKKKTTVILAPLFYDIPGDVLFHFGLK